MVMVERTQYTGITEYNTFFLSIIEDICWSTPDGYGVLGLLGITVRLVGLRAIAFASVFRLERGMELACEPLLSREAQRWYTSRCVRERVSS
jgi:hypothetical protein